MSCKQLGGWQRQNHVTKRQSTRDVKEKRVQERLKKKKAGAGGFVLCANGADAGVVLFI